MRARCVPGLLVVYAAVVLAVGCGGRRVNLNPTTMVPAAQGQAALGHDANGNTTVDLTVKHLARPNDLTPARNAYVVWVQPNDQPPMNKGELRIGDNLQGELKIITPARSFDLFITAEDRSGLQAPTGPEVLRATLSRK